MSVRRTSHFSDPKLEQQVERLRRALSDEELKNHSNKTGGTHGLGPQEVFESTTGSQAKANAALNSAKSYADNALDEAKAYADLLVENAAYILSGPSSERPVSPPVGTSYFDTDLGVPVWWAGATWVDAAGAVT